MGEQAKNPDEIQTAQFDSEAAQAAERVVNDGNPEFAKQHPNAVADKAKAERMAYATKRDEEEVAEEGEIALVYLSEDMRGDSDRHMQKAQEARQRADEKADNMAGTYDRVEELKRGSK